MNYVIINPQTQLGIYHGINRKDDAGSKELRVD